MDFEARAKAAMQEAEKWQKLQAASIEVASLEKAQQEKIDAVHVETKALLESCAQKHGYRSWRALASTLAPRTASKPSTPKAKEPGKKKKKSDSRKRVSPEVSATMRTDRAAGMTYAAIAKKYGFTQLTVAKYVKGVEKSA